MKRLGFDLVLLGDPAAGKDTQAALLRKQYILKPVESGKHWRKVAARNDAIGRMLKKTFSLGKPTPVKLMKEFLQAQLKRLPRNQDLIFIGNPRLKPEAQLLQKILEKAGRDFFAIYIRLPEAEIRKRSKLRMRDDQDLIYIENRIKFHRIQVSKTALYLEHMLKLKYVNGNQPIKKVHSDIIKTLNAYKRSQRN